jgi:uncharacterized cupredoxin-like copper-binding protein
MNIKMLSMAGLAIAGLALVACGGGSSSGAAVGDNAANAAPQVIKYVLNAPDQLAKDADGVEHDTFIAVTSTTVQLGRPVQIVVENYDEGDHGMFFAELGLNKVIKGTQTEGQPAETSFTFTPTKAGDLRWYCPVPCDSEQEEWAMGQSASGPGQDGFMAGYITVK